VEVLKALNFTIMDKWSPHSTVVVKVATILGSIPTSAEALRNLRGADETVYKKCTYV
jgi:hypothetical protein